MDPRGAIPAEDMRRARDEAEVIVAVRPDHHHIAAGGDRPPEPIALRAIWGEESLLLMDDRGLGAGVRSVDERGRRRGDPERSADVESHDLAPSPARGCAARWSRPAPPTLPLRATSRCLTGGAGAGQSTGGR